MLFRSLVPFFATDFDSLTNVHHQLVERFHLGMAAVQFRNLSDAMACLVLFDDDGVSCFIVCSSLARQPRGTQSCHKQDLSGR